MADSSQLPMVVEPFFQGADASVSFTPVMTAEDLAAGLEQASAPA